MVAEVTREDVLETMLDQAVSTIEFLHDCLVNPPQEGKNGGFVYAYPDHTLRDLENFRAVLPERDWCMHSRVKEGCDSCARGAWHREVMAAFRDGEVK